MARLGGGATLALTATVAVAGLALLQVGGHAGGAPSGPTSTTTDDSAPPTMPATTVPATSSPTTTSTTTTTTTTTTSTTTTTTTTTTTPTPSAPVAVPASVATTRIVVGAGGVSRLGGTCPEVAEVVFGPVVIVQVGESTSRIDTGITAAVWVYDWQAPPAPIPIVLQVWCGDPANATAGYPSDREIVVEFVDQLQPAPPPAASAPPVPAVDAPLPSTD